MNKNCYTAAKVLSIVLLFACYDLYPQYLRDSTKFIGLNGFYPSNDSEILNLYNEDEKYPVTLHEIFSIPEVTVNFNGKKYPFSFDFGNSGNITVTTALADSIEYDIADTAYTYTPDGKIRGRVYNIILAEFQTLGALFNNEKGSLSDWSVYSTNPFNGLIGLKYAAGKCITLSYAQKTLAISRSSILPELQDGSQTIIRLENYKMHPYGIHFKGKVDGREAIIYFDTGKSHSAVNQNFFPAEKTASDKSGSFYKGTVEIVMGDRTFKIYYPRIKNTERNIDSSLPVGIEIGSDILKHFLLTIDRTDGKNLLAIH